MSLTMVKMAEEVWLTCVSHSLTTEKEEIMGLLLGDIQQTSGGGTVALIWGAVPQMRSDRRKDRVETNPELLAAASEQADIMSRAIGRITRVIGWYHSHPHITVLPSHVDVRTQAMYQLLDSGFIGLIFSCFDEDPVKKVGRIQVIAYQSLDGRQRTSSPVAIDVQSSSSSLMMSASASGSVLSGEAMDQDTGDSSRATKSSKVGIRSSSEMEMYSQAEASHLAKQQKQENNNNNSNNHNNSNINNQNDSVIADMSDSEGMTPGMQEALHRSNVDVSGAGYTRKEVALQVVPMNNLLNLDHPLESFVKMHHVLFEEEKATYRQALEQNSSDGKIYPLTYIHHTSNYHASLCKLMDYCLNPAVASLQQRLKENEIRLAMLKEEAKSLEAEATAGGIETKAESPRRLTYQRRKAT